MSTWWSHVPLLATIILAFFVNALSSQECIFSSPRKMVSWSSVFVLIRPFVAKDNILSIRWGVVLCSGIFHLGDAGCGRQPLACRVSNLLPGARSVDEVYPSAKIRSRNTRGGAYRSVRRNLWRRETVQALSDAPPLLSYRRLCNFFLRRATRLRVGKVSLSVQQ